MVTIFSSRLWKLALWLYLANICISTYENCFCFIINKSMVLYLIVILRQDSHIAETAPYINKSTLKPALDVEYNFLTASICIALAGCYMRLFFSMPTCRLWDIESWRTLLQVPCSCDSWLCRKGPQGNIYCQ